MRELKFSYRGRSVTLRGGGGLVAVCCCALLVALLLLSAAAGMGYAQAGRRVAKPKSDPPVPKSAETTPAPVAEPTPEPEKISLLVVSSVSSPMRFAMGAQDNLPGVVGRRLQDSKRLQVASGGEMSRGEANKRAKETGTKTFVVWLELDGQGFDIDPMSRRTRLEDLSVRYVVLEPGTAKTRDQGNVPLRSVSGGVFGNIRRLPSCYPQPHTNFEYAITVAGIETAERILHSFSLISPAFCS
ncbi:MAG TPA: hypothetical protein VGX24_01350 [Pyrinomonadaceae bacterium]|jgi:hypothetical protein|nr:hypothetical protein [Pyrinomonadaceae bacterium]